MPGFLDGYLDEIAQVATPRRGFLDSYASEIAYGQSLKQQEEQQASPPKERSWAEWLNPPLPQSQPPYVQSVEGGGQGNPAGQAEFDAVAKAERVAAEDERLRSMREKMNAAREKVQGVRTPEVASLQSFMDTASKVPGVRGNIDLVFNALSAGAAKRINAGEGTDEDFTLLAEIERMNGEKANAAESRGFLGNLKEAALDTAPFMAGMALAAPVREGAKAVVKRAGGSALAAEAAALAGGVLAPTMAPLTAKSATRYAAPTITEHGDVIEGDETAMALAKGIGSTATEVASESLGELAGPAITKYAPTWAGRIASAMRGKDGTLRAAFADTLQAAGIQNAPVEWLEERAAEIMQGGTGLEDNFGVTGQIAVGDWEPAIEQSLVELALFGGLQAPGAIGAVADTFLNRKTQQGVQNGLGDGAPVGGDDGGVAPVEEGQERLSDNEVVESAGGVEPDGLLPESEGAGVQPGRDRVAEQIPGVAAGVEEVEGGETRVESQNAEEAALLGPPMEQLDWNDLTARAINSIRKRFPDLNEQDAEDLAQETMLRVSQTYDPTKGTPQALVGTILGRLNIDAHRKAERTGEAVGIPEGVEPVDESVNLSEMATWSQKELREYVRENFPNVSTVKGRDAILRQISDILSGNQETEDGLRVAGERSIPEADGAETEQPLAGAEQIPGDVGSVVGSSANTDAGRLQADQPLAQAPPATAQDAPGQVEPVVEPLATLRLKNPAYVADVWKLETGGTGMAPSKSEMLAEIEKARDVREYKDQLDEFKDLLESQVVEPSGGIEADEEVEQVVEAGGEAQGEVDSRSEYEAELDEFKNLLDAPAPQTPVAAMAGEQETPPREPLQAPEGESASLEEIRSQSQQRISVIDAELEATTKRLGSEKAKLLRGRKKDKAKLLADLESQWEQAKADASRQKQEEFSKLRDAASKSPERSSAIDKAKAMQAATDARLAEQAANQQEEQWAKIQAAGGYETVKQGMEADIRKLEGRIKATKPANRWKLESNRDRMKRDVDSLDGLNEKFGQVTPPRNDNTGDVITTESVLPDFPVQETATEEQSGSIRTEPAKTGSLKQVGTRGQTAIPGLEEEAAIMEKKDAAESAVLKSLADIGGDDFAQQHQAIIPQIKAGVDQQVERLKKITKKAPIHPDDMEDEFYSEAVDSVMDLLDFPKVDNWLANKQHDAIAEIVRERLEAAVTKLDRFDTDVEAVDKIVSTAIDTAVRESEKALTGLDLSKKSGEFTAMRKVSEIATKHGVNPNEVWRDVYYEPDGAARDIVDQEAPPKNKVMLKTAAPSFATEAEVKKAYESGKITTEQTLDAMKSLSAKNVAPQKPMKMDGTVRPAKPVKVALPAKSIAMMEDAIKAKDAPKLKEMLHPSNKEWRRQFSAATGVKLPKTVKGTESTIASWAEPESEESPQKIATDPKQPFMGQWKAAKKAAGDGIVLFRVGDFYEMMNDDAKTVAKTLGLTLTTRDKAGADPIPMAGFPYHQLDGYITKLIKSGHRVAIVEQIDESGKPKNAEVTRIVADDKLVDQTPDIIVGEKSHADEDVQRVLRREQENGNPAWFDGSHFYLKAGKHEFKRDAKGRQSLVKLHDLSEGGIFRQFGTSEYVAYNRAAVERKSELDAIEKVKQDKIEAANKADREEAEARYKKEAAVDTELKAIISGEKLKGKQQTLPIKLGDGKTTENVEATVYGNLAIHKQPGKRPQWSVMIVPAQGNITHFDSKTDAVNAVKLLNKLSDWNFEDPKKIPNDVLNNAMVATKYAKHMGFDAEKLESLRDAINPPPVEPSPKPAPPEQKLHTGDQVEFETQGGGRVLTGEVGTITEHGMIYVYPDENPNHTIPAGKILKVNKRGRKGRAADKEAGIENIDALNDRLSDTASDLPSKPISSSKVSGEKEAAETRISQIKEELEALQKKYEAKSAKQSSGPNSSMVPTAIKSDVLRQITNKMDKLDAELLKLESKKLAETTPDASTAKKKPDLKEQAKSARQEMKDAADDLGDFLRGKTFSNPMLNPELVAKVAKLASKAVKAGTLTFAEFLADVTKAIGKERAEQLRPVLESEWNKASGEAESGDGKAESGKKAAGTGGVPDATSIKNAVVDELRAQRGLPEMDGAPPQTQEEWMEVASQAMLENPLWTSELLAELTETPRNLSPVEIAALQQHYRALNDRFASAAQDLSDAVQGGDPAAIVKAQTEADVILSHLQYSEEATKAAGREWGRSGVARQIMLAADFSLVGMMNRAKVANGGQPLDAAATAKIKELADKVAELQDKLDKHIQEQEDADRERRVQQEIDKIKKTKPTTTVRKAAAAKRVDDAWANLMSKAKGKLFSTPVDIEVAAAGIELVRAYVDMGVVTFTEFMANVRKKVGDKAEKLESSFRDSWEQVKAQGGIPVLELDPLDLSAISRMAKQLQRALVEAGVTERDAVVDAVHTELQEIIPDITRRQVMDAMSGYGNFRQLSKDEIDVIIRDINGQLQQLGKLDDMEHGDAPRKTGQERREPTDEERRLIKKVNEAKKRGGYNVTDPARQLKGALQAAKTAVRNQIADMTQEIEAGEKNVKSKTSLKADAELEQLRKQRDELRELHSMIFPKEGLTDEQKIKAAEKALDKAIAQMEADIASGDIGPKPKNAPLTSPALDAKRARLAALRAQRGELREAANPNARYKASLTKRLADWKKRIAEEDFAPRKRPQPKLDKEALAIKYEIEQEKMKFDALAEAYRRKRMTVGAKVLDNILEVFRTTRNIMTGGEFSAVFRQGGFVTAAHPVMAAKALPSMFHAFTHKKGEFESAEEIRARENYLLYKQAGLAITVVEGKLSKQEEATMSRWSKYIPGIAGSVRAYVTFINRIRADYFDALVQARFGDQGITLEQAKVLATLVNVATGRGVLGPRGDMGAVAAASVFFAPKFVASRFQLAVGQPLWKGDLKTKRIVAQEYARAIAGTAIITSLLLLMRELFKDDDDEDEGYELDPRSSDFGKVRIGNTRIDPLFGLSQTIVFATRVVTGQRKSSSGEIIDLRGEDKSIFNDVAGTMGNFLRSKLAPAIGASINIASGEDIVGEPATVQSEALKFVEPMTYRDIREAMVEQGVPVATATAMVAMFGMGASTYGDHNHNTALREILEYEDIVDAVKANIGNKDSQEYKAAIEQAGKLKWDYLVNDTAAKMKQKIKQAEDDKKPDETIQKLEQELIDFRMLAREHSLMDKSAGELPDALKAVAKKYLDEAQDRRTARSGGGTLGQPKMPSKELYRGRPEDYEDAKLRYEDRKQTYKAEKAIDAAFLKARKESRENSAK